MHRIVNPFVYDLVLDHHMPYPTIPPWMGETYAQCYEDIVMHQLLIAHLKKLGTQETSVSYIEIGANHPVCTSSFFLLHKQFGISGILVEANPKLAETLRKFRPNDRVIEAAVVATDEKEIEFYISPENEVSSANKDFVVNWKEQTLGIQEKIKVKTVRVNELLEQVAGANLVLLSIDVEGLDLDILKDIDYNKYRPFLIQIEPSEHFIPENSNKINEFMKEKGYTLITMNYVNMIFIDSEKLNA